MSQLEFWFEFGSTYAYPAAMRGSVTGHDFEAAQLQDVGRASRGNRGGT